MAGQEPLPTLEDWEKATPVTPAEAAPAAPAASTTPAGPPTPDPSDIHTPVSQTTATSGARQPPDFFGRANEMAKNVVRTVGPPVLEIGGAILGSRIPGAGPVLKAIGSGVGSMFGTVAATPITGPPSVEDVAWSGASGLAGEAAPAAVFGAARGARNVIARAPSFLAKHGAPDFLTRAAEAIRAPMGGRVSQEAREAFDRGINLTPGMATEARPIRIVENVVHGSLTSGKYEQALKEIGEQFSKSTQEELAQFGTLRTPEALGRRVQAGIQHAERASRRTANEAYEAVWKLADEAGTNVSITPLRQYSVEELAKRGLAADVTSGKGIRFLRKLVTGSDAEAQAAKELEAASAYVKTSPEEMLMDPRYTEVVKSIADRAGIPVKALMAVDNQIPFRAAHYLRSAANDLASEAGRTGDYQTAYLARQVHARLDESMELAAESAPGLKPAYQRATKLWRDLRSTYSEGIVADIVKADPHMVLKQIEPHTVKPVRVLRDTLGERAWLPVQRALAEEIVEDASKITNTLHKWGPETLREIFPRGTADGLFQLGRIADLVGAKGPGTGKVWIELTQAGAFAGLMVGKQPGKATAVLLGPHVLGRIVLSPTGRQLLTTGLKEKAAGNIGAATRFASQLAAWLVREKIIDPHRPATTPGPAQPTLSPAATSGRGAGPGPRGGTIPQPQGPPSLDEVVVPPSR